MKPICPFLICALFMPVLLCLTPSAFSEDIPSPPGATNNWTPNGDGSANPWDGSSSDDPQDPSRPAPGPCYEWEDGSPGDWIDQCSTERAAFIEAEKKLKDETDKILERFDRICGWWHTDSEKLQRDLINYCMMPLASLTTSTIDGILDLMTPSVTGVQIVDAFIDILGAIYAAAELEANRDAIQAELDENMEWIAALCDALKKEIDMMEQIKDNYAEEMNTYKDALADLIECCPEFEETEIVPPEFDCDGVPQ